MLGLQSQQNSVMGFNQRQAQNNATSGKFDLNQIFGVDAKEYQDYWRNIQDQQARAQQAAGFSLPPVEGQGGAMDGQLPQGQMASSPIIWKEGNREFQLDPNAVYKRTLKGLERVQAI